MSSPTVAALEARFNSFSIIAVIFCSLSALFGVYLVLFILAMWSTYRRSNGNDVRLRVVTMVLFMTLLIHYVSRAVQFGRSRIMTPPASEQAHVTVPLLFITTLTTTVASFVSDGLLAWRFYVIFERRTWTLYVPATALTINALLGFSGNCLYLSFYNNPARYSYMQNISFKISVAWGWSIFAINTLLTIAIMAKILLAARRSTGLLSRMHGIQYSVIIEALSESAFVTWFGLALFEISSLAPTEGHITNAMNFGYVMRCIIPIFFGISQCLITVRLGFSSNSYSMRSSTETLGISGPKELDRSEGVITVQARRGAPLHLEEGIAAVMNASGREDTA